MARPPLPPRGPSSLLPQFTWRPAPPPRRNPARDYELVALVELGYTHEAIARRLHISRARVSQLWHRLGPPHPRDRTRLP